MWDPVIIVVEYYEWINPMKERLSYKKKKKSYQI